MLTGLHPTVAVGGTLQLQVTAYDRDSSVIPNGVLDFGWSSSDGSVAAVDSTGLVAGKKRGTTTIAVTELTSGKTTNTTLTVETPIPSVFTGTFGADGVHTLIDPSANGWVGTWTISPIPLQLGPNGYAAHLDTNSFNYSGRFGGPSGGVARQETGVSLDVWLTWEPKFPNYLLQVRITYGWENAADGVFTGKPNGYWQKGYMLRGVATVDSAGVVTLDLSQLSATLATYGCSDCGYAPSCETADCSLFANSQVKVTLNGKLTGKP